MGGEFLTISIPKTIPFLSFLKSHLCRSKINSWVEVFFFLCFMFCLLLLLFFFFISFLGKTRSWHSICIFLKYYWPAAEMQKVCVMDQISRHIPRGATCFLFASFLCYLLALFGINYPSTPASAPISGYYCSMFIHHSCYQSTERK